MFGWLYINGTIYSWVLSIYHWKEENWDIALNNAAPMESTKTGNKLLSYIARICDALCLWHLRTLTFSVWEGNGLQCLAFFWKQKLINILGMMQCYRCSFESLPSTMLRVTAITNLQAGLLLKTTNIEIQFE